MPARWRKQAPRYSHIPGIDSYVEWVLGAGRRHFFDFEDQQRWLPVMIRLHGIAVQNFAAGRGFIDVGEQQEWRASVRVPRLYAVSPAGDNAATYCTAWVTEAFFQRMVRNRKLQAFAPRVTPGLPLGAASLFDEKIPQPALRRRRWPARNLPAGTVLVGIIDDGIAFAHERFRKANGGTRVESVWLQDGSYRGPVQSFEYGREIDRGEINALLAAAEAGGEEAVYRQTGLIDYLRPGYKSAAGRTAHGTHVMDLACGFDPGSGREDRPIVCVQLPAATTADTSGSSLDPFVCDAMQYILDRADALARAGGRDSLPVVVNFSYGTIAGPHDGTSDLEQRLDALVRQRRQSGAELSVVLPSGNSHLSRCHAEFAFTRIGQSQALHWRVLPDDKTPSFLELWLPRRTDVSTASRIRVTVTPPGGVESEAMEEEPNRILRWLDGGNLLCEVSYDDIPAPCARGRFLIALQPTAAIVPGPDVPLAPSGTWRVRMENRALRANQPVRAWIQRDESLYGHPRRGRQSYFDEECYVRFDHGGHEIEDDDAAEQPDCHVKREGLINALATGTETVVVGGLLRKELLAAAYSAGGPISPRGPGLSHRDGPDVLTVSDDSRVHRGVMAAGSRSGSVVAMNGTSVAAPQITRLIADELAAGGAGNPADVRDAVGAIARAEDPSHRPPPPPSKNRGGEGRIVRRSRRRAARYDDR